MDNLRLELKTRRKIKEQENLRLKLKTRRIIKEQERQDWADFWLGLIQVILILVLVTFHISFLLWKLSK